VCVSGSVVVTDTRNGAFVDFSYPSNVVPPPRRHTPRDVYDKCLKTGFVQGAPEALGRNKSVV